MKRLFFIFILFLTVQTVVTAQSKGLSEEGYKHWIKAITRMEDIQKESDYLFVIKEFLEVLKTDSTYQEVYYNLGILYSKIGELGGGVPCFNYAKKFYEKYKELKPSEKAEVLKELARLEVKKEDFLKNIGLNMVFVEKGIYKEKGNPIEVESFYIQNYLFTVADFKRLITPIAVSISAIKTGKNFSIPTPGKALHDNDTYILNYLTAEQIVEVLNYVTGKNYFIPTQAHWESIAYILTNGKAIPSKKKLEKFGIYVCKENCTIKINNINCSIYEWVNLSKGEKKLAYSNFPFTGNCTVGMNFLSWEYFNPHCSFSSHNSLVY